MKTRIDREALEPAPAPGTEADEPGPPLAYDVRELLEGDPEEPSTRLE